MTNQNIPIGHINLGFMTLHASEVKNHTSDVARFFDYFVLAQELDSIEPGSSEAHVVFEKATNTESLLLTLQELAAIAFDKASQLEERAND